MLPIEFPCGRCEDVKILFQHYDSFDNAKSKWMQRFERVDFQHIIVVFLCWKTLSDEQLQAFLSIPYPKVMVTTKPGLVNYDKQICMNLIDNEKWFDINKKRKCYQWMNFEYLDWVGIFNKYVK